MTEDRDVLNGKQEKDQMRLRGQGRRELSKGEQNKRDTEHVQ